MPANLTRSIPRPISPTSSAASSTATRPARSTSLCPGPALILGLKTALKTQQHASARLVHCARKPLGLNRADSTNTITASPRTAPLSACSWPRSAPKTGPSRSPAAEAARTGVLWPPPSSATELRTPAACSVTEMPSTVSKVVSGAVHVSPKTEQGMAGLSRVSLITVAQPREELARRAVALLRARIEGGIADERVQVMLEPTPVVRRSTAPFRLGARDGRALTFAWRARLIPRFGLERPKRRTTRGKSSR
jgi:hypothetical protein